MTKSTFTVLRRYVYSGLKRRGKRIESTIDKMEKAVEASHADSLYRHLSETAHEVELLCKDLRNR